MLLYNVDIIVCNLHKHEYLCVFPLHIHGSWQVSAENAIAGETLDVGSKGLHDKAGEESRRKEFWLSGGGMRTFDLETRIWQRVLETQVAGCFRPRPFMQLKSPEYQVLTVYSGLRFPPWVPAWARGTCSFKLLHDIRAESDVESQNTI